jgi:hypothetical protein
MTKREQEKLVKHLIAAAGFVTFGVRVVWPAVRQSRWFMALPRPDEAIATIRAGVQQRVARTRLWINQRTGGGS